jgi:hypothetical protein
VVGCGRKKERIWNPARYQMACDGFEIPGSKNRMRFDWANAGFRLTEARMECDGPRKRKKRYGQAHQAYQMVKHQGRAALIGKSNLCFASVLVFRSMLP